MQIMPRVDFRAWLFCPDISSDSSSWHKMAQAHMMSRWAKECIKDSSREQRWPQLKQHRSVSSCCRQRWSWFTQTRLKTIQMHLQEDDAGGERWLQWITVNEARKRKVLNNGQFPSLDWIVCATDGQPRQSGPRLQGVVNLSPKGKRMPIRIRNLEPLGSLCADDLQNTESWSCHGSSPGSLP